MIHVWIKNILFIEKRYQRRSYSTVQRAFGLRNMAEEHAHAASLFSPQSKFKVKYSAVVEAPKNIHRFNGSKGTEKRRKDVGKTGDGTLSKKQRVEAVREDPSSSSSSSRGHSDHDDYSSDSDGGDGREMRGAKKKETTKSDMDSSEMQDKSLQRTIFVGNLSEATTKKNLKAHFQKYDNL